MCVLGQNGRGPLVQEHFDVRAPRIARQLGHNSDPRNGSSVCSIQHGNSRYALTDFQASPAMNKNVAKSQNPVQPPWGADVADQRLKRDTEIRLFVFTFPE